MAISESGPAKPRPRLNGRKSTFLADKVILGPKRHAPSGRISIEGGVA